ncbi:hypothetical protein [Phenylobacterium sp. VNQ135]|uniref:hypothetical protein n=1 Tax=Phenylobacterium sp. VNQ135 TaxID=3400922 RepID=UPI003C2AD097
MNLAIIIWRLLNLPDADTGRIVTGGLDMLPRFNMAIALARHLKAPHEATAALVAARKAIQDGLDVQRNRAVHGIQYLEEDGKYTIETHRGKGAGVTTEASPEHFEQVASDIMRVRRTLQRGFREAGLDWLPHRP